MIKPLQRTGLDKADWIRLGIISVLYLFVYYQTYDEKVSILGDNASYYLLAKSIAGGYGYVNIFEPNLPPHNHFPPGYPFLISIVIFFFSSDFQVIKMVNGLLLWGVILLTYLTALRLNFNKTLAFVVAVVVTLNSNLLYYGSIMMSEVPFAFFTLITIYLTLKTDWQKNPLKNVSFYLIIIFLIYCFYLRTFGVALLGAVVLYMLLQKQFKLSLIVIGGFIAGIIPWQIRGASLGGSSQFTVLFRKNFYAPEEGNISFGDMIDRIISNFSRLFSSEIPQTLFPNTLQPGQENSGTGLILLSILIVVLSAYSIWILKHKGILIGTYIVLTLLILFVWPDYFSSIRYLAPVVPILTLLFFHGLFQVLNDFAVKLHPSYSFNAYILLIIALFYIKPVQNLSHTSKQPYPRHWADFFALAQWAKENTPHDAIFICRKVFHFSLISDRMSYNYKYTTDDKDLLEDLDRKNTDFVVYDQLGFGTTPRYLGNAINKNMESFEPVIYIGPKEMRTYLFKYKGQAPD